MAGRIPQAWVEVEGLIDARNLKSYGEAAQRLLDLRDVSDRAGTRPEFDRRLRLQVEHVLVRRPTTQVNIDERLVRLSDPRRRFRSQEVGQREPANPQRTDLEEITP